MDYSAKIYGIYLRYVSKEDIHVYSVDECFIDVTNYLQLYHLTAKEMAVKLMQAVMEETGITATAGVSIASVSPDWKSHGVQFLMAHCKHKRICLHYSVVGKTTTAVMKSLGI